MNRWVSEMSTEIYQTVWIKCGDNQKMILKFHSPPIKDSILNISNLKCTLSAYNITILNVTLKLKQCKYSRFENIYYVIKKVILMI